tara:strand:+ start:17715 stop:17837 length:123 start_codon:yes stop_codon:yes gene_type:complete
MERSDATDFKANKLISISIAMAVKRIENYEYGYISVGLDD